jgi:hypothetical protein
VLDRNVSLGDREEAGEPRLGGQQVVMVRVGPARAQIMADVEDTALAVVKRPEVHRLGNRPRPPSEPVQGIGNSRRLSEVAQHRRGLVPQAVEPGSKLAYRCADAGGAEAAVSPPRPRSLEGPHRRFAEAEEPGA